MEYQDVKSEKTRWHYSLEQNPNVCGTEMAQSSGQFSDVVLFVNKPFVVRIQ